MGIVDPTRAARPQASWVGPIVHADVKLPKLERLVNSFDAQGRRVILHSVVSHEDLEPGGVAPTARVTAVGVAVVIGPDAIEGPMIREDATRGWIQTGPKRWERKGPGEVPLTLSAQTWPGPSGDLLVAHLGSHLTEPEIDRLRALVAQGSGVGPAVDRRTEQSQVVRRPTVPTGNVAEARSRLGRRPLLAVTGAGISSASGVLPFLGPGGLDSGLGLFEPFPGRLFETMLAEPDTVLDLLARWHLSFLAAMPTPAHHALVDLERRGHLAGVFTTNIDRLHHAAGARRVAEAEQLSRAHPPADAGIVVAGLAHDPSNVIERARATGATVVIVDRQVPDWAQPDDLVVLGDPQTIVPELAEQIAGLRTPLTVLGHPSADAWVPSLPGRPVDVPWSELASLADLVRRRSPARRSTLHGPRHWLSVAWIGAHLAASDAAVDPLTVALFAMFHDCQRHHDGHDLEHGGRGADEAQALLETVDWISADQRDRLAEACRWHTHGRVSDDPTIGACWDADRLDLWRVGATPLVPLLSRPVSGDLRSWSRCFLDVGDNDVAWDDWNPVAQAYAAVVASR